MPESPTLTAGIHYENAANGSLIVHLSGYWQTGSAIPDIHTHVAELTRRQPRALKIKVTVTTWDSRLPCFLFKLLEFTGRKGIDTELDELPDSLRALLQLALTVPERSDAQRVSLPESTPAKIGRFVVNFANHTAEFVQFIGELMLAAAAAFGGKARFRWLDVLIAIQDAGPGALPIVGLISLLVGLILAFVGAVQLALFGAQIYIADLVALGTVREMGTLMTAVIMSGRTGAAYAAQLGMMKVNSEIDALRTMGLSPIEFLIFPRMLGLILMMPLLCLYADLMGIIGGAIVSLAIFDIAPAQYYYEIRKAVQLDDLAIGLFKGLVFAALIASAGCMRGMRCENSAAGVGDAATAAVVDSIIYIVVADSVITLLCNQLGI
ncbi:MlaE family ABC transporter permease [Methylomonas rhizoryzae]|uniref:MlaE family ABC transporter permease n=1 Tax=Methylomonas rhizoryzae TaxID=2608981 RepID=UPI001232541D|nr:ABC transporter permease [Methylomonas rhizoryzae]